MANSKSGKVLRNTMLLYIRMLFLTIISLFTYRVVFQCLGASDYGTYNVVGGFVSMFGFLSSTLTVASQRYFAVGLSTNNWRIVNKYFSVNIVIYCLLSIIILALAETVGFWIVATQLNLDYSRFTEIIVVYQTSVAVFLIGLMVSPFLALLVADENFSVYSWMSILEGLLKLAIAYFLNAYQGERLIIYSLLLLFVCIIINGIYLFYCARTYKNLKFKFCREREEYQCVFSFVSWNLIGAIAAVGKNQGLNLIINIFFGTVINASRAIAYQINAVVSSFSQNFMKAVDPRIIKAYASNDESEFLKIIYISSKLSYYLLFAVALPFIINADYVLKFWLGAIPEYTVIFVSLALIDALVLSITDPILTAVQAIGIMRVYQITVGFFSLLNLPISYFALKISNNPVVPFIVAIVLDLIITVGRLVNFKILYPFSILKYIRHVFLSSIIVTVVATVMSVVFLSEANGLGKLILNVMFSEIIIISLIMIFGLSSSERSLLNRTIPFMRKGKNNG